MSEPYLSVTLPKGVTPASNPAVTFKPPKGWVTPKDKWASGLAVLSEVVYSDGRGGLVIEGTKADGTCLLALSYPGGSRWARFRAETDWALEESYVGSHPAEAIAGSVASIWAKLVEVFLEARKLTEAEFGGRP